MNKDSFVYKEISRVSKARIKKLKREIYNCCGINKNLCLICFDKHHITEELREDLDKRQTQTSENQSGAKE